MPIPGNDHHILKRKENLDFFEVEDRRKSAVELVVEKKLRPGDLIPSENVLAENQKIFDPLLFKILVSDIDYRELIEIRDIMERGVVRLVIENATDEQLGLLRDVMDQMDALH